MPKFLDALTVQGTLDATPGANMVSAVVRGTPGQTADIQQWHDSAGATLARVSASGFLFEGTKRVATLDPATGKIPLSFLDLPTDLARLGAAQTFTQTQTAARWVATDAIASGFTGPATARFHARAGNVAGLFIEGVGTETAVLAIVRGAPTQTSDLQQWQVSAGTVLTRVTSSGRIVVGTDPDVGAGPGTNLDSNMLKFRDGGANPVHLFASGASLRSNSSILAAGFGAPDQGTLSATIQADTGADMKLSTRGGASWSVTERNSATVLQKWSSAGTVVQPVTTTIAGLVVRGLASQTADLQQWQDSAGAVLARVTAAGRFGLSDMTLAPDGSNQWLIRASNDAALIRFSLALGTTVFGPLTASQFSMDSDGLATTDAVRVSVANSTRGSIRGNGEYENHTAGNGVILKSPSGTRYRITVANDGALVTAAV